MNYEGNIIRPPSEAHSIILQITAGCSHNKCIFCGAYIDKHFKIRSESLDSDLDFASQYCKKQKKIFLADGDALIIPQDKLKSIFSSINKKLPWVNRISLYANGKAIRSKSLKDLLELKKLGLHRVYLGLESGSDEILTFIKKGESAQTMIEAAQKITSAGIYLSVTVLLGIGGIELSRDHAEKTGKVLTLMSPKQIAALTVMPILGTQLDHLIKKGAFRLPSPPLILQELKILIQNINLNKVQFFSNHASNYLALDGRLQRDKPKMILQIDEALAGRRPLIKEEYRSL